MRSTPCGLSHIVRELGDEPVPIAAVERADELDDLARIGAARPLEQERGRVQRYVQELRLLLVRHRRLDRLDARRNDDAVARREQLVERRVLELRALQPG